jgi:deazaflavin-dependent oxidoreductase (nitroreductase family)
MADDGFLHGPPHTERYLETNGEDGYVWRRGTTVLLLYTIGRKSGEQRIQPLIYREIDGKLVIVASKGGAPEPPAWYLNLRDQGEAEVQIKADRFPVRVRDAEGDERERLWDAMNEVWPDYARYQERTDRRIPVVVLERD